MADNFFKRMNDQIHPDEDLVRDTKRKMLDSSGTHAERRDDFFGGETGREDHFFDQRGDHQRSDHRELFADERSFGERKPEDDFFREKELQRETQRETQREPAGSYENFGQDDFARKPDQGRDDVFYSKENPSMYGRRNEYSDRTSPSESRDFRQVSENYAARNRDQGYVQNDHRDDDRYRERDHSYGTVSRESRQSPYDSFHNQSDYDREIDEIIGRVYKNDAKPQNAGDPYRRNARPQSEDPFMQRRENERPDFDSGSRGYAQPASREREFDGYRETSLGQRDPFDDPMKRQSSYESREARRELFTDDGRSAGEFRQKQPDDYQRNPVREPGYQQPVYQPESRQQRRDYPDPKDPLYSKEDVTLTPNRISDSYQGQGKEQPYARDYHDAHGIDNAGRNELLPERASQPQKDYMAQRDMEEEQRFSETRRRERPDKKGLLAGGGFFGGGNDEFGPESDFDRQEREEKKRMSMIWGGVAGVAIVILFAFAIHLILSNNDTQGNDTAATTTAVQSQDASTSEVPGSDQLTQEPSVSSGNGTTAKEQSTSSKKASTKEQPGTTEEKTEASPKTTVEKQNKAVAAARKYTKDSNLGVDTEMAVISTVADSGLTSDALTKSDGQGLNASDWVVTFGTEKKSVDIVVSATDYSVVGYKK